MWPRSRPSAGWAVVKSRVNTGFSAVTSHSMASVLRAAPKTYSVGELQGTAVALGGAARAVALLLAGSQGGRARPPMTELQAALLFERMWRRRKAARMAALLGGSLASLQGVALPPKKTK